ncbi:MAG: DUF308 domain-containing protein, partial [Hyphomicrobiaceae bacterium]
MTTDTTADLKAEAARIRFYIADHWHWFLGVGILLALAGAAAIAFPFFSTLAAKVALGWLLLFTGVVNVVHAVMTRGWRAFGHNLIVGLL